MKKIFLLLISIVIVSCTDNDDEPIVVPFVPVTITPILISKRNINPSVDLDQQNTVINIETDWTNLINHIESFHQPFGINYTDQYFTETTIDFNNFTVIAIFDQVYGNGGHSIDITNITEYENNIVVTVENLLTGNGSSVGTQPYHIVKIPRNAKPIVFE
jgi:hypothetical protein